MKKRRSFFFVAAFFFCGILFAGYQIQAGNHTNISDKEVDAFVAAIVKAVNAKDEPALLALLHPECQRAIKENADVKAFLKFLQQYKVSETYKWCATTFKEQSAVFAINRFVVKPAMNVDIFWDTPTKEKTEHMECLSVTFVKNENTLLIVSYMNDQMMKKPPLAGRKTDADGK